MSLKKDRYMCTNRNRGFTLVEVLITVAILSILAAIAVPSYQRYVQRTKVQEPITGLADLRVKMEQYFLDNRRYDGYVDATCNLMSGGGAAIPGKYFSYACASDVTTFTITADGLAAQGMGGYQYTVDQANVKSSTLPNLAKVTGCWLAKPDDSCH
jgi:type IV pilus assembly protein PilE